MRRFLVLTLLLGIAQSSSAVRGPVRVSAGTIVSDRGTLIRGAYVSTDNGRAGRQMPTLQQVRDAKLKYGLNAIHNYTECWQDKTGSMAQYCDQLVSMTQQEDMYLVITIGGCGRNGQFDYNVVMAFWNFYAPRYKDKTHVIYEIQNEPGPPTAPYPAKTMTMEQDAYNVIRKYAPNTHVLVFSYVNMNTTINNMLVDVGKMNVDWMKTSIGFHAYTVDALLKPLLVEVKSRRPDIGLTCTEWWPIASTAAGTDDPYQDPRPILKTFEQLKISYLHFTRFPLTDANFKTPINKLGVKWVPDFGSWPLPATSTLLPLRQVPDKATNTTIVHTRFTLNPNRLVLMDHAGRQYGFVGERIERTR